MRYVHTTSMLVLLTVPALAHVGGAGSHLNVGYYFGHSDDFEQPANPPQPATLLIDTHPWELGDVAWNITAVNEPGLVGFIGEEPGFQVLAIEDQEFGGHGYFTWLDPDNNVTTPAVRLHMLAKSDELELLSPVTLESFPVGPSADPIDLPVEGTFHGHLFFFVDQTYNPQPGDIYTATFMLSDSTGQYADSQQFTVRVRIENGAAPILTTVSSRKVHE